MRHKTIAAGLIGTILTAGAFAAERIEAPGAEPLRAGGEWPSYNRSLDGQRYSPLDQINRANAGQLQEVCRIRIDESGSFQAGLVVIDGVMYATTPTDTIALDPVTCEVLWRHSYRRATATPFPINRGVAHYAGRLYRGTDDGRLIALDARTGTEIWTNVVGDPAEGEIVSGSPLAWNGMIIAATAVSEFGARGRVLAYDAATGRELWRFNTVPTPDEANADTWRNTFWNDTGGGGGGSWSHFALDPATREVFVPVGNPIPDFVPAEREGDNLYTNCVLVLDAITGKLKWWYQLKPADGHDHDLASAPVLYRDANGGRRVAAAGKDGYLHIVDRRSHKRVARVPVTTVDDPMPLPTPEGVKACPGPAGGVEWNGPAFDPGRNRLYVGSLDYCALYQSEPGTKPVIPGYHLGGTWTGLGTPRGWIFAVDAGSGDVAWKYHGEHPFVSAVTPTAGGIVFTGDNHGNLFVFDSDSGDILHKTDTGGSMSGGVITYEVDQRQYVAVTSGNVSRSLFGARGRPTIIVMALPQDVIAAERDNTASVVARGKRGYATSCSVCHGADGKAWNNVDLAAIRDKMTLESLVTFIREPRAPMPKVFAEPLSAADETRIREIATYLMNWE